MKVIQLNKSLTLRTGLSVPAGCIIAPLSTWFNVTGLNNGSFPAQFGIAVFVDQNAYTNKLQPLNPNDISDFPDIFRPSILLSDYVTKGADNIAAQAVKHALIDLGIAAGKINIIDL